MIDVKHYLYHRGSGKSNAAKEQGKDYELYKRLRSARTT